MSPDGYELKRAPFCGQKRESQFLAKIKRVYISPSALSPKGVRSTGSGPWAVETLTVSKYSIIWHHDAWQLGVSDKDLLTVSSLLWIWETRPDRFFKSQERLANLTRASRGSSAIPSPTSEQSPVSLGSKWTRWGPWGGLLQWASSTFSHALLVR